MFINGASRIVLKRNMIPSQMSNMCQHEMQNREHPLTIKLNYLWDSTRHLLALIDIKAPAAKPVHPPCNYETRHLCCPKRHSCVDSYGWRGPLDPIAALRGFGRPTCRRIHDTDSRYTVTGLHFPNDSTISKAINNIDHKTNDSPINHHPFIRQC